MTFKIGNGSFYLCVYYLKLLLPECAFGVEVASVFATQDEYLKETWT